MADGRKDDPYMNPIAFIGCFGSILLAPVILMLMGVGVAKLGEATVCAREGWRRRADSNR